MSHILHIDVSIRGDYSISRSLGKQYIEIIKERYTDVPIVTLDLATNPPPHLDFEGLSASWTPEANRSPAQVEKNAYRIDNINKLKGAKSILLTVPMFNWNIPSPLKAFIDQIVYPGVFSATAGEKGLAGIPITIILASGGGYQEGSGKELMDFGGKYLELIFGLLGATDVKLIRSEYGYAKFGVTELNDLQIKSQEDATTATLARAKAI